MRKRHSSQELVGESPWYPIELPISYESLVRGSVKGSGRTLTMNSRAVRFACDRDLAPGLEVRLVIAWPAHLPSGAGLTLSLFGAIERSALREVEVAIFRLEFRTRLGEAPEELSTDNTLARSAG